MTKYSMKRLLLMTMLCCGLTAAAQNEKGTFSIKPLVGVNMTTLPGGLSDDYYHNKFGLTAGVEAEYGVNSWLGLSLGAIYSEQGAKIDGELVAYAYDDQYAYWESTKSDGKVKCNYVNLPLMASFYVPAIKGLALKAGVQMGILVSSRTQADVDAVVDVYEKRDGMSFRLDGYPMPVQATVDSKCDCKSLDFGIPIGFSYESRHIVLDARYYFGLAQLDDSPIKLEGVRTPWQSITLGYRLHL